MKNCSLPLVNLIRKPGRTLALSLLIAFLALAVFGGSVVVLSLCVERARFGAYLSILSVCALGILTPGTLLDLCRMSTMRCRMVMQPAMIILFSAALLCALTGAILTARKKA